MRFLTDPMLRSRVGHLRRHGKPVEANSIADIDAVLISHGHRDHLDPPSLRTLDRDLSLIVAEGIGPIVSRLDFKQVTEVRPGDRITIGSATVIATNAEHDGRHAPWSRASSRPVGFVIEAGDSRTYFAGDTDLFDGMSELGPIDLALLPIWGWGPKLGSGHLNPHSAAKALTLLRPRVAIPIHWGTLFPIGVRPRRATFLREPPQAFARHAAELAPEVDVQTLEPGQSTSLS